MTTYGPEMGSQQLLNAPVSDAWLDTKLKYPLCLLIQIHFIFVLGRRDCLYIVGQASYSRATLYLWKEILAKINLQYN